MGQRVADAREDYAVLGLLPSLPQASAYHPVFVECLKCRRRKDEQELKLEGRCCAKVVHYP